MCRAICSNPAFPWCESSRSLDLRFHLISIRYATSSTLYLSYRFVISQFVQLRCDDVILTYKTVHLPFRLKRHRSIYAVAYRSRRRETASLQIGMKWTIYYNYNLGFTNGIGLLLPKRVFWKLGLKRLWLLKTKSELIFLRVPHERRVTVGGAVHGNGSSLPEAFPPSRSRRTTAPVSWRPSSTSRRTSPRSTSRRLRPSWRASRSTGRGWTASARYAVAARRRQMGTTSLVFVPLIGVPVK